jgi:hypothetical protein
VAIRVCSTKTESSPCSFGAFVGLGAGASAKRLFGHLNGAARESGLRVTETKYESIRFVTCRDGVKFLR